MTAKDGDIATNPELEKLYKETIGGLPESERNPENIDALTRVLFPEAVPRTRMLLTEDVYRAHFGKVAEKLNEVFGDCADEVKDSLNAKINRLRVEPYEGYKTLKRALELAGRTPEQKKDAQAFLTKMVELAGLQNKVNGAVASCPEGVRKYFSELYHNLVYDDYWDLESKFDRLSSVSKILEECAFVKTAREADAIMSKEKRIAEDEKGLSKEKISDEERERGKKLMQGMMSAIHEIARILSPLTIDSEFFEEIKKPIRENLETPKKIAKAIYTTIGADAIEEKIRMILGSFREVHKNEKGQMPEWEMEKKLDKELRNIAKLPEIQGPGRREGA